MDELKATFGSIVKNTLLSNDIEDKDIVGVIGVDFTEEDIMEKSSCRVASDYEEAFG